MRKTLSITIDDSEKADGMTISGSLDPSAFNPNVILRVGNAALAVNSQELAQALAEVVAFQTPKVEVKSDQ